jgi:hypothetical protein
METKLNRKALEQTCKYILLSNAMKSQYLKENKTFDEHMEFCRKINKLSYVESVSFALNDGVILDEFGIRDFESKYKKFMKYSLAALAGNRLLKDTGHGGKIAIFVYYMFRKLTDPCYQACIGKFFGEAKRVCRYRCQVEANRKIVQDIRAEISKCQSQSNPIICEKKLRSQYVKWSKKLQEQIVKQREAEARLADNERQRREKENKKKAKLIAKQKKEQSKNNQTK